MFAVRSLCRVRVSSLVAGRFAGVQASQMSGAADSNSVYIGNIPYTVTSTVLSEHVAERVSRELFTDVKIIFDQDKARSKGFGYVAFLDKEGATNGIAALKGMQMGGRECVVDYAVRDKSILRETNSVFVGNINGDCTEEDLRALMGTFIGLDDIQRLRFGHKNENNGLRYAHVDLVSTEVKQALIDAMAGVELLGQPLKVDSAIRKPPYTKTVFVGNLSWDVTPKHMTEMLNEVIGTDRWYNLRIANDKVTGNPRGFSFIDFSSTRAATAAIAELNGIEMFGRQLRAQISEKVKSNTTVVAEVSEEN